MSVPNWLNDASQFQNGDGGAFNAPVDPSLAFMSNPNTMSFDPAQLSYQQVQARMPGSNMSNGSPAPQTPVYPTQSVVPSKRPRPPEESMGASPGQYPGTLPGARSQTPQSAYANYPGMTNGAAPFSAPSPYPPYTQANTNSSQSPVMQNQAYKTSASPQNPQTVSPSPFSPGIQPMGAQHSPAHSDHGSRVNTPQGGPQPYPQGLPYGMAPGMASNQQFPPTPTPNMNGSAPPAYPHPSLNHQQQQQRAYEARMRQMQQMNTMGPSQRPPNSMMNPMIQPPNQAQNAQMAQYRAQKAQGQQPQRPHAMEQMSRQIISFMQQRGLPFNPTPVISGKPFSAAHIFMAGIKLGGSRRLHAQNMWPSMAQMFQFPPPQCPAAGAEMSSYWVSNLTQWEIHWMHQQQQSRQQRAMSESMRAAGGISGADPNLKQGAYPRDNKMQIPETQRPAQIDASMQNQAQVPIKGALPQTFDPRYALPNGQSTQPQSQPLQKQVNGYMQQHASAQQAARITGSQSQAPFDGPKLNGRSYGAKKRITTGNEPRKSSELQEFLAPLVHDFDEEPEKAIQESGMSLEQIPPGNNNEAKGDEPESQVPSRPRHYGGMCITLDNFGTVLGLVLDQKQNITRIQELCQFDIEALVLSLRSGIDGEIRFALDVLAAMSYDEMELYRFNDDILESLVECAEDQLKYLTDASFSTSDSPTFTSYEALFQNSYAEAINLQEIAEFGSKTFSQDRSANRLICVLSILGNISTNDGYEQNLIDAHAQKMLLACLRLAGTHKAFLGSQANNLDFRKDMAKLLVSVVPHFVFRSRDDVQCLLLFLLSFAPTPPPSTKAPKVIFPAYDRSVHPCLPDALEIMADLVAIESTHHILKAIFYADAVSTTTTDLLTRAFGLAVAPLPEADSLDRHNLDTCRFNMIAQGLLLADALIDMIPGSRRDLARRWLSSQDQFPLRLELVISPYHESQFNPDVERLENDDFSEVDSLEMNQAHNDLLDEESDPEYVEERLGKQEVVSSDEQAEALGESSGEGQEDRQSESQAENQNLGQAEERNKGQAAALVDQKGRVQDLAHGAMQRKGQQELQHEKQDDEDWYTDNLPDISLGEIRALQLIQANALPVLKKLLERAAHNEPSAKDSPISLFPNYRRLLACLEGTEKVPDIIFESCDL